MPKKVIIYARVSTRDQDLELQLSQLKQFAKDRGFEVTEVYEEKMSGMNENRTLINMALD